MPRPDHGGHHREADGPFGEQLEGAHDLRSRARLPGIVDVEPATIEVVDVAGRDAGAS